jgi:DNA-binding NarL/FixJ family response regulator
MSITGANFEGILKGWQLSDREVEITKLILSDITATKDIANELNISPITVRNHLEKIYKKSGCKNKNNLIVKILHYSLEQNEQLKKFYKKPNVLLVEDEVALGELIKEELEEKNISVTYLDNSIQIQDALMNDQFDFIITDMKMPGMTGGELIKFVKQANYYKPQIIVITGFSEYKNEDLYNEGVIAKLDKPFDINILNDIILNNYSDDTNISLDIMKRRADFVISTEINLNQEYLGFGGIFIHQENLKDIDQLADGNLIDFTYKVEDLDPINAVGEIMWIRKSGSKAPKGLGIKIISQSIPGEEFMVYINDKQIKYFIPKVN